MNAHGSQHGAGPLICSALPLGYGPAAKLVVLAEALQARGVDLIFVGRGVALELAARHKDLFCEVFDAPNSDAAIDAVLRDGAGMLSIMERDISARAGELGKPLFVVDSLHWMRDTLPGAWRSAQRLWAQNFIGLHESGHLADPRLTVVGPIVAPAPPPTIAGRHGLLVNLGGCEAADGDPRYAQFVVDNLRETGLPGRFGHDVTLLAGERCIASLRSRYLGCGWKFLSLPHDATLTLFDRAALLLTAPGLTATLEAFQRELPTCFLPPQNYSQWCSLRSLRAVGLAPAAFHWEDVTPESRLGDRLPEAVRNPIVRKSLADHISAPQAARTFQCSLGAIEQVDLAALARSQRNFFIALGDGGVALIADQLAAALGALRVPEATAAAT